jgi:hypothetical protein
MKIKELIEILKAYNPELPVCCFDLSKHEYFEIDDGDESIGSINRVWDDNSKEWILSLNENTESLMYRFKSDCK